MMVWVGNALRVSVATGKRTQGEWTNFSCIRDVYAMRDDGCDVRLLVADDTGQLQWVSKRHCTVQAAPVNPRMAHPA